MPMLLVLLGLYMGPAFGHKLECNVPGQCINSNILHVTDANSVQNCQTDCRNWPNCNWFSYSDNFCQLFSDCNTISNEACHDCVTSELDCEQELLCNLKGFCQGNLTNVYEASSHRQCWLSCNTNKDCAWYSFRKNDKKCFLFFTCVTLNEELEDFISGQSACTFPIDGMTKLLVVTGDPEEPATLAEIHDFSEQNLTCQSLGHFPAKVSGTAGGLLNDQFPLVCGGFINDDCYIVGQGSNPVASMSKYKTLTGSAVLNNSLLWITGGFDGAFRRSSTEFMEIGKPNSVPGPNLPIPMLGHCLISLTNHKIMVIGGDPGSNDSPVCFFYDFKEATWKNGPNMKTGRSEHACGSFMRNGKPLVMVTGGTNAGVHLNSTEFYDPELDIWTDGPPLPLSLIGAQMLTNPEGDGVLVLGGKEESNAKTDKIFKLTCSLDGQCVWTRLDKNLQVARSAFVAMWIPDVLVNCSV